MAAKIKMFPSWYKELRELNASAREALIEIVLENLRRDINDRVSEEGSALVKDLRRNYEFVGFSPSVMYLKARDKDQEATYVHPWAMVTLIFKHKRLPTLTHVNAAMRKDEMILAKIPFNHEVFEAIEARGITG